jgi:acyl-CoA reductase-like NAD-dependent aldehyde dehydrogenase
MSLHSSLSLTGDLVQLDFARPLAGVVDGEELAASNGEVFKSIDPGSGAALADVYCLQEEDVDLAVKAANRAFEDGPWSRTTMKDRSALVLELAGAVEKNKKVIARLEAMDCGKIVTQAEKDVDSFISVLRFYANLGNGLTSHHDRSINGYDAQICHLPMGVCASILPWNFPLELAGWSIAPALIAGNTCVVKPAEDTSLSTLLIGRMAMEVGFPKGVINVVPGIGEITGKALANNKAVAKMTFTGSPEVGQLIGEACIKNFVPYQLELGGKGAAVVFDDVDISFASKMLVEAITYHSGQVCCTASRWIISEKIFEKFLGACLDLLSEIKIGYQLDEGTTMGPVVSQKQLERVIGYEKKGIEEGAQSILQGGRFHHKSYPEGHYVLPAILYGDMNNVAAREEIFGPVAYVCPFSTEAEAIQLANHTEYGLGNSVWTNDAGRAQRVAKALKGGTSWINCHNKAIQGIPYGGIKKSGFGGYVICEENLFDYMRMLSVINKPL